MSDLERAYIVFMAVCAAAIIADAVLIANAVLSIVAALI